MSNLFFQNSEEPPAGFFIFFACDYNNSTFSYYDFGVEIRHLNALNRTSQLPKSDFMT